MHKEVQDERVPQLMASFLGRRIVILTSSHDHCATSSYAPYRPEGQPKLPLYIGHIQDKHFLPLVKGLLLFRFPRSLIHSKYTGCDTI